MHCSASCLDANASAGAQDIVVSQKAWDALPNDLKEIVTVVFESVHQRTKAMAINPGMSNLWRKQAEAKGVKSSNCLPRTLPNLRRSAGGSMMIL
jgi:TRAP-type C4-dicarboxylate transport system substrate-binding protein